MRNERGFSLVELMVAMLVTLIVSGAIVGLLSAGGNSFRREPEISDRQQNIRLAMDAIARDAFEAGNGLPTFSQVFTRTDPAGSCAAGLDACGAVGSGGANSDVLEMVSADERCPVQTVCNGRAGGSAGAFVTREGVPACFAIPGLALLTDTTNTGFAVQIANANAAAACTDSGNSARNGSFSLLAPLAPWTAALQADTSISPAAGSTQINGSVNFVYAGRVVRYRIGNSTDTLDAAPALWRSASGRYRLDGTTPAEPGVGGFAGGQPWEMVARGIEDFQVSYLDGTGVWSDQPPVSTAGNWTTLVQKVRITLSARTLALNLQGQTTAAGGAPNAIRGQLVTEIVPRAAFTEMQMCLTAGTPCTAAQHIQ
jgi:prepilin-type N-terminal cleavage/methylation domain-containing protein